MERDHDRHPQFAQERQDVAAGRAAEDSELVLQADHIDIADIEEVRGAQIGGKILFFNFEANYIRILVARP